MTAFEPSRAAALQRLDAFLPNAGRAYASTRNYDDGPAGRTNVSELSPYVRHRLISESEIADAVLQRFSASASEKFIQEVCWRTYWKGWLQLRPAVWDRYLDAVADGPANSALQRAIGSATAGATGIDCFDAWVHELVETGYLHNHARMWFASIWIHTLKLPWALGADFFLRHLIDGDAASNTLSWRWVAGLHTVGKTYLARADNIETYTRGRFADTRGLAHEPAPLIDDAVPKAAKLKQLTVPPRDQPVVLILTEDDLSVEQWLKPHGTIAAVIAMDVATAYAGTAANVVAFKRAALQEALARATAAFKPAFAGFIATPEALSAALTQARAHVLVTAEIPLGPPRRAVLEVLALVPEKPSLFEVRNPWDEAFWPYATAGFFKLKERIPDALRIAGIPSNMPTML